MGPQNGIEQIPIMRDDALGQHVPVADKRRKVAGANSNDEIRNSNQCPNGEIPMTKRRRVIRQRFDI
jgi:hypothetical protein